MTTIIYTIKDLVSYKFYNLPNLVVFTTPSKFNTDSSKLIPKAWPLREPLYILSQYPCVPCNWRHLDWSLPLILTLKYYPTISRRFLSSNELSEILQNILKIQDFQNEVLRRDLNSLFIVNVCWFKWRGWYILFLP